MFSSMKRKLFDQKLAEQQHDIATQKEMKMRQQRGKIDPKFIEQYILGYILMKEMEDHFNLTCIKSCIDFKNEWINDKEQQCLRDCNSKTMKFLGIAKEHYKGVDDELKLLNFKDMSL